MVKRGETLWRDGDVASARSFFERAAEEGLAEGALALGGTYDPYELGRMRARGPKADNALARRWYEKARDLGSSEATERLRRF
jgi:TPR repeat protein